MTRQRARRHWLCICWPEPDQIVNVRRWRRPQQNAAQNCSWHRRCSVCRTVFASAPPTASIGLNIPVVVSQWTIAIWVIAGSVCRIRSIAAASGARDFRTAVGVGWCAMLLTVPPSRSCAAPRAIADNQNLVLRRSRCRACHLNRVATAALAAVLKMCSRRRASPVPPAVGGWPEPRRDCESSSGTAVRQHRLFYRTGSGQWVRRVRQPNNCVIHLFSPFEFLYQILFIMAIVCGKGQRESGATTKIHLVMYNEAHQIWCERTCKSPSGGTPRYLLIRARLQARIQNGVEAAINTFRAQAVRAVQYAYYGARAAQQASEA